MLLLLIPQALLLLLLNFHQSLVMLLLQHSQCISMMLLQDSDLSLQALSLCLTVTHLMPVSKGALCQPCQQCNQCYLQHPQLASATMRPCLVLGTKLERTPETWQLMVGIFAIASMHIGTDGFGAEVRQQQSV